MQVPRVSTGYGPGFKLVGLFAQAARGFGPGRVSSEALGFLADTHTGTRRREPD